MKEIPKKTKSVPTTSKDVSSDISNQLSAFMGMMKSFMAEQIDSVRLEFNEALNKRSNITPNFSKGDLPIHI